MNSGKYQKYIEKKIEHFRFAEAMLWLIEKEFLQNDMQKIENLIQSYLDNEYDDDNPCHITKKKIIRKENRKRN
jgi:hypothetical protein